MDPSLIAYSLGLPDLNTLGQEQAVMDVDGLHAARKRVRASIGHALAPQLREVYASLSQDLKGPYQFSALVSLYSLLHPDVSLRGLR